MAFRYCDHHSWARAQAQEAESFNPPYVENNPLAQIDPDGRDGQGQDGKRVITVFLNYAKKELDAGKYDVRGNFIKTATLDKPDWNKLQKAAGGYGFELVVKDKSQGTMFGANSSFDFEAAAGRSELIVVAGHSGNNAAGEVSAILLSENSGIVPVGSDLNLVPKNEGEVSFGGQAIAYFGCNTDSLPIDAMIKPTSSDAQYIGVKDGDGYGGASVPTNNRAAYNFVEAYMKSGGNLSTARASAQKTYQVSKFVTPLTVGGKTRNVNPDRRDEVTTRRMQ